MFYYWVINTCEVICYLWSRDLHKSIMCFIHLIYLNYSHAKCIGVIVFSCFIKRLVDNVINVHFLDSVLHRHQHVFQCKFMNTFWSDQCLILQIAYLMYSFVKLAKLELYKCWHIFFTFSKSTSFEAELRIKPRISLSSHFVTLHVIFCLPKDKKTRKDNDQYY